MKNPVGRPSKYQESFVEEVDRYLETTGKEACELPTKQGFALWISVDDDTLDNWAKEHREFFGALKKLMQLQATQLVNDGIYGGKEVNATIVKLLLQNNHHIHPVCKLKAVLILYSYFVYSLVHCNHVV